MLLAWGLCRNEDLKSAVVVGLPHNSLKSLLPPLKMTEFLAETGISDPELVFGSHFFPHVMSECFMIY